MRRASSILRNLQGFLMVIVLAMIMPVAMAQTTAKDTKKETKSYPPGSAWTLSWPLGTHVESSLDTLLYNYQRRFVTSMTSDAWASTGAFTSPAINMIYFDRLPQSSFFFENALSYWTPTFAKQKFYNVYIPMTQLSYGMGYGTENRTDHLQAIFAGNVNRKIGLGAWVEYPYTKGSYAYQSAKGLAFGLSGYYTGDRYEMQAFYNHYNHLNKENGGITDDLYITNPAELQGGVTSIEPQSIPVHLKSAHNRLIGSEFYMSHAYKVGFWRDITTETDTVERQEYVPVTKFVYSFNWKDNSRKFINDASQTTSGYWGNTYFYLTRTNETASRWSIANTVGVEMIEGFNKWAKFGLSAYATYEIDRHAYEVEGYPPMEYTPEESDDLSVSESQPDRPAGLSALPEGYESAMRKTRHRLWAGGRIEKTRGSVIRYSADAKFGLLGDAAGDIDVSGALDTKFRLGRDTVRINVNGFFRNTEPDYVLNHYVGNHFIWNNNFGKERSFRAEGRLTIPWTRTELRAGFENIQNKVYFDQECLPRQYGGNIQIFSAAIDQKIRAGIWNWNNRITYQKTSDAGILPLPELTVYSNMFLYFHAFRALTVQIGVDVDWYTSYRGLAYQPATMSFHTQGENGVKVGNFINSNVYLTCKLYKVRFFVMCSHLNQGWFSKNYFALPHYPVDPRQLRLGLSIDFNN